MGKAKVGDTGSATIVDGKITLNFATDSEMNGSYSKK
jgi:hypothetical protein